MTKNTHTLSSGGSTFVSDTFRRHRQNNRYRCDERESPSTPIFTWTLVDVVTPRGSGRGGSVAETRLAREPECAQVSEGARTGAVPPIDGCRHLQRRSVRTENQSIGQGSWPSVELKAVKYRQPCSVPQR